MTTPDEAPQPKVEQSPTDEARWVGYAQRLVDKNKELNGYWWLTDLVTVRADLLTKAGKVKARVESLIIAGEYSGQMNFSMLVRKASDVESFSWRVTSNQDGVSPQSSLVGLLHGEMDDYNLLASREGNMDEAAIARFEEALAAIEAEYDKRIEAKRGTAIHDRAVELFRAVRMASIAQMQLAELSSDPTGQAAIELLTGFDDAELGEFIIDSRGALSRVPPIDTGIGASNLAALLQPGSPE